MHAGARDGWEIDIRKRITGKVREITSAQADFTARVLRNGTDDKFEASDFRADDDFYISLVTSVGGYAAVYAQEDDGYVYLLFPYPMQENPSAPVKANRRYVFFSKDDADASDLPYVRQVYFDGARDVENYVFYVLFSPNEFYRPTRGIAQDGRIKSEDFLKWLSKTQSHDPASSAKKSPSPSVNNPSSAQRPIRIIGILLTKN
ncbi:MAG: DUF4384 domain-containing protein [Bacteroidales bacterium]|nr:DUF4384 domain-containing protein [Bacteroidales bacterium]